MDNNQFDEIRSYNDAEARNVYKTLAQEPDFLKVLQFVMPGKVGELIPKLRNMESIDRFQREVIYPFLLQLEQGTTQGISGSGFENIRNAGPCIYMSNHRDIVLDSTFLCKVLIEHNLSSVEIAIGDNLLIYPWITHFVRANKSFIVKRGGSPREMLANSMRLSAYISHTLHDKKSSIWIAQREGRCKDSNDRTQESLLKMLSMSGKGQFLENIMQLNICPLSISYEYDPCDYLKAKEFQQKRDNPEYKKTQQDDLLSMQTGILGKKGRIMFRFTPSINNELAEIARTTTNKNEQIELTARTIDRHIHAGYEIYSGNKIACDLLLGTDRFAKEYTAQEKTAFEAYIKGQLDKIQLENKDEAFLRRKLLEMYANPLINHLK